jgi:hypothetical protein
MFVTAQAPVHAGGAHRRLRRHLPGVGIRQGGCAVIGTTAAEP